ncbi:MAG: SIS domain-containing protein [candidate division Zixibacteria bacterium]|nr:SIS domain-containing protein [candidate division Zixibacteria bacterium]
MNQTQKLERFRRHAEDSVLLRRTLVERLGEQIIECSNLIAGVIGSGGKLMIVGNGESAAAASHFATQLLVRYRNDHPRQPLPAIALTADSVILTASVDQGYKDIYSRQIDGLGHKGDMLIVLATGEESENITRAIQTARVRNMLIIALLGANNSRIINAVDRALIVPHPSPQRVQEEHLFLIHLLVELIETDLCA